MPRFRATRIRAHDYYTRMRGEGAGFVLACIQTVIGKLRGRW